MNMCEDSCEYIVNNWMAGAFLVSWKFAGAFVYMLCQVMKHNLDNGADQEEKKI